MARSFVVLFRGHKDRNYLKTHFLAPCFSEDRSLAILYGKGGNDESNSKLKDGYLTSLEFYGEIFPVADKVGLDLLNNEKRIEELKSKYDAVKCKDGVILVFDTTKLKMLTQELT